ncbi:helix-turn-helix transcriptional regulator [Zavarzinia sp. CC-PAN008]|uniref:helix-turn-helix transcriptional regulator n=1 Tax=Zavarzinia sp. CC-PAN008 TaxID=3243332 RepID=UPI003F7427F4
MLMTTERETLTVQAAAPRLLRSAQVRAMVGDPSDVTLWRWVKLGRFPAPDHVINRRNLWQEATVRAWLDANRRAA